MLQIHKSPSSVEQGSTTAPDVAYLSEQSLADLYTAVVGFIHRQFLIILLVLPVTIGLGLTYLFTAPVVFTATASIIFDPAKVQLFPQSMFGDDSINSAMVDSQIELLKSENFALSIVNKLHLSQDPEFTSSAGGLVGIAKKILLPSLFSSHAQRSESELTRDAVHAFERRLTVSRVGATYVIDIEFAAANPDRAAELANAVADGFIADQLDSKYTTIQRTATWLQARLSELQAQASAAERAVVDYKAAHNIVDTGGHLIDEQQLSELNTALIKARADVAEAQARLNRVTQILHTDQLDPTSPDVATVTDALHNPIITKLRQEYLELAQREADWSKRYGPNHMAVVNLRDQMAGIRRSIVDELKQIAEADKSDYDIAKAREDSLEKTLAERISGSHTTNKAQIELRQLESAAQSYRTLYNNFQQRYTDSVQQQSFPISGARVISRATPPLAKSSPKSLRILAIATAAGLMLGVGSGMLREISDRGFRTSEQVTARLKTQVLALVPMITPIAEAALVPADRTRNQIASRVIGPITSLLRYVIDSPESHFTEAIRSVKVSIDLSGAGKVVGLTSSLPNEGKSTIAMSLAQLCAQSGVRAILVDSDLRKRSLSQQLAPNPHLGLIDVVMNTANLDDVILFNPVTNLSFLPAGLGAGPIHSSEVLASDAMKRMVLRLRENYDYVIIDLPPLAPVVDVRAATHFLDCYVFVIEWGKTKIDTVEHSFNSARGVYDNLLGVILNKVDFKLLRRYENNRYDYDALYGSYGYTSRDPVDRTPVIRRSHERI